LKEHFQLKSKFKFVLSNPARDMQKKFVEADDEQMRRDMKTFKDSF